MNAKMRLALLLAGVVILAGGLAMSLRKPLASGRQTKTASVYYCPMHPSYTADRPGSCPICGMNLVAKETAGQAESAHEHASAQFKTICYLHNCEKLHEGKPCPMTVVAKPGEKVTCPICGTHIAEQAKQVEPRKILYWTDPMIPGSKSDKPGKSPMGMDLVPVYAEEAASAKSAASPEGYAPVLLTQEKQQLIGVRTAPAVKQMLRKTIRAVGTVAHDPELYQAQQEFIQAFRSWQQAKSAAVPEVAEQAKEMVDASKLRLRHLGFTEELIDEMAGWEKPDHRLLLGGAGEYWVYASVYEYELPLIRAGQSASIDAGAIPGQVFIGQVKSIDPMLDPATRTARVRILVEDPHGLLKPSMYVNVSVAIDLGNVIAVPIEAVFSTGDKSIVFVDKGQGLFEPRQVELGAKADAFYEVKRGIAEGEPVVTSGNFLIDSESRLRAAVSDAGEHKHGQ